MMISVLFVSNAIGQEITINGTVTSQDDGAPLPGVNVLVVGTTNGTQTDFDGNYTITASAGQTLRFSYIGMATQDIIVSSSATINAQMVEDANKLSEVVVVGYTTQTRGNITGSITSVDVSEALKLPLENAAEALQGRANGVSVISNSEPGGSPTINIRGIGTSGSTGPLFIIDGVQTTDASIFNSINANDIQQINVLKDGAASIYGSRAANGVVIVTTKGGSYNSKTQVSLDMYTGMASATESPSLLNAQQHGQMIWDGLANDGATLTHPQYGTGSSPTIPTSLQGTGVPVTVNPNGTDWWSEITRTAPTSNISLALQSGTENSKSYASFSYLSRDGVLEYTGFKKGNIQLNNEFKLLNDKLKIGQHLNVAYSNIKGGEAENNVVEGAVRNNPLLPVYDDNGEFAGNYSNTLGLGNDENPFARLSRAQNNYNKTLRVFGDIYLSYKITDDLSFKTTFSGNMRINDTRIFTSLNPEFGEPRSFNTLAEGDSNSSSWTWNNILNYNKSFGNHNINAIAGIESVENISKGKVVSNTDYFNESPLFYLLGNGFGDPNIDSSFETQNTLYSLFGSADYNYAQKYFLTATLRYDKSSRFAGSNKDDIFPSVSGGWLISKEGFYPEDAFVNRVKVKGSWGQLGNQFVPVNNPTLSLFAFSQTTGNYAFTQGSISSGAYLSQVGNPDLKWETSETTNYGIELGMLNSKLNVSLEVWKILTDGLITLDNQKISTTAPGATAPYVNLGNIENKGFDLGLDYGDKTNGDFSYNIGVNISSYRNEVLELINGTPVPGNSITSSSGVYTRTEEGEPLSYFYGRIVDGFDADGRWTYKDVNGDGTVDDDDRTKIGSPHPDFTYGISLSGEYKNFDFSMFFNGSQGNDIYNHSKIYTDFPVFVNGNRSTRVLDSWTPTNTNATLPALSNSLHGVEIFSNSYFVEDGSYFRLKNLQIGYSLPDTIIDKLGISNLRLYVQGTNIFTITGYEGLNPEITPIDNLNLGIDRKIYPLSRIYTIGLNLKF